MAKAKKSKELSLEEKLEQALVPVNEQPYDVPENWCWSRLKLLTDIKTGKKDANYGSEDGEYYFFTCAAEPIRCQGYSFEGKAILLAGNGDIGNISMYDGKFEAYQRTYVLQKCRGVLEEYLYYYFKYRWVDYNKDKMFGTAIPYIRLGNLQEYEVPLPPLAEQQRIVEQIEQSFVKLDDVKEKAQAVIEEIDKNIEAILCKAFEGYLTNKWRIKNGVTDVWEDTELSKIVSGLKYGSSEKSEYDNKGTPVLRIPNIGDGVIDFSDLKFFSEEIDSTSHEVFENDILVIRSNGSRNLVGRCALVPELDRKYAYASFLIRLKVSDRVLPQYLVYLLNSSIARIQMFSKAKSSSGIHNINSKELGAIKIKLPSIKEQEQILLVIGSLISGEKKAKEIAEMSIDGVDKIKKSILAKAFRGELGTNNPDEESAIELLKRVIMEVEG